jgi:putative ABC transport system permease protein
MRAALRDFRYGARSLIKSPGLALVSIFALTIGIGLTTTMFSIVYGALMKGLPFDEPDRIVAIQRNKLAQNMERLEVPISDFADYRARHREGGAIRRRVHHGEHLRSPACAPHLGA